MEGNSSKDNILSVGQLSLQPGIKTAAGTSLQSADMEAAAENTTVQSSEQVSVVSVSTLPFFLDDDTHVAEEVEVETSTPGECEESQSNADTHEVMNFEIAFTMSPALSSSTAETVAAECSGESMQIFLHAPEEEAEEGKQSVNAAATGETAEEKGSSEENGDAGDDEEATEREIISTSASATAPSPTQKPMVSQEEDGQQRERENHGPMNDSVSSSGDLVVDESGVEEESRPVRNGDAAEAMSTTNEPAINEKENNESMDENNDDNDNDGKADDGKEEKEAVQTEATAPVRRVSCIQFARKADNEFVESSRKTVPPDDGNAHAAPRPSSSAACDANLTQGKTVTTTLPASPCACDLKVEKYEDIMEDEDSDDSDSSHNIWIPEITTTTLDDEVVQTVPIVKVDSRGVPIVQNDLPYCSHPCCWMMKELWSCLPWWMNYTQVKQCHGPCPPVRPPGFEDPPESQWVTVDIHHTDPSDGAMRYKCRNCEGVVEHRSTKQKLQLNFSRLRFQCKDCDRRYITKKQLKLHSMRHNVKTRSCPYCDKLFLTQNELRNHMNTHTRERPYSCPVCFQRFAHSSRYYAHIRNMHKKYDCNDCYSKVCLPSAMPSGMGRGSHFKRF